MIMRGAPVAVTIRTIVKTTFGPGSFYPTGRNNADYRFVPLEIYIYKKNWLNSNKIKQYIIYV
jgi:hypothetical protein